MFGVNGSLQVMAFADPCLYKNKKISGDEYKVANLLKHVHFQHGNGHLFNNWKSPLCINSILSAVAAFIILYGKY